MRFTIVFLCAMLCFSAWTANAKDTGSSDDAALLAAAEQMIHEGGRLDDSSAAKKADDSAASTTSATAADSGTKTDVTAASDKKPAVIEKKASQEAQTPVFSAVKNGKSENSLVWRLVMSLGLIAVVGGGVLFSTKRWGAKKNKGGDKVRIEMLHQFHLGPKRSLALVRVAGEVALIGVTDHTINMLKTVTLIDDELETVFGEKSFNNFLEDDFSVEDVRSALKARA